MRDLAQVSPRIMAANVCPRVATVYRDVRGTREYRRATRSEVSNAGLHLAGLSERLGLPGMFLMQGHRRVYSADEADKCFMSPNICKRCTHGRDGSH